jgi:hypothetical protein
MGSRTPMCGFSSSKPLPGRRRGVGERSAPEEERATTGLPSSILVSPPFVPLLSPRFLSLRLSTGSSLPPPPPQNALFCNGWRLGARPRVFSSTLSLLPTSPDRAQNDKSIYHQFVPPSSSLWKLPELLDVRSSSTFLRRFLTLFLPLLHFLCRRFTSRYL